jgi:hypothetical protein
MGTMAIHPTNFSIDVESLVDAKFYLYHVVVKVREWYQKISFCVKELKQIVTQYKLTATEAFHLEPVYFLKTY